MYSGRKVSRVKRRGVKLISGTTLLETGLKCLQKHFLLSCFCNIREGFQTSRQHSHWVLALMSEGEASVDTCHCFGSSVFLVPVPQPCISSSCVLHIPTSVGWLVCNQNNPKTTEKIFTKLGGRMGQGPEWTPLTFGVDPGISSHFVSIFSLILRC